MTDARYYPHEDRMRNNTRITESSHHTQLLCAHHYFVSLPLILSYFILQIEQVAITTITGRCVTKFCKMEDEAINGQFMASTGCTQ